MKVFGFAGFSGSGKTTLIEALLPRFVMEGLRVSLVKHAHHEFDIDRPGKDSYRHREAGATEVMLASAKRWVLMHELRNAAEPELPELLARFAPCDLVLVEGFKRQPIPKLEIHRAAAARPLLFRHDEHVIAIATDEPIDTLLPQFDLEDYDAIAEFILAHLDLLRAAPRLRRVT
ncbi:MAG: molybdopterin-guanine dinucleotide biosynthesis protein B [Betaproteobacteria bacterium]|nr:molybdopterin-guanine dinucleotide biosynthesis protein B [Betaproteobacteria bacterium]